MPQDQGQQDIGRNRPPRVQIEYSVHVYGAERKIQLPFVMGVMADLTGKSEDAGPVAERQFLEIDSGNFNERLKALKPRVAFTVPNVLSGQGLLPVDITFESIDDFAPDAIARKVEPLRRLLEMREKLSHLLAYMDGKDKAERFVSRLLDEARQQALSPPSKPDDAAG